MSGSQGVELHSFSAFIVPCTASLSFFIRDGEHLMCLSLPLLISANTFTDSLTLAMMLTTFMLVWSASSF